MNFDFSEESRREIWSFLHQQLEAYYAHTADRPVAPPLEPAAIRNYLHTSFQQALPAEQALRHVLDGLDRYLVHTPHPNYYGLFNPRAAFPGILADTITATYNPQMAAWSHAPFAVEVENLLVQTFGTRFGWQKESCDGVFTSGGAEANLTAVQTALNHVFPHYASKGIRGAEGQPVLYCSAESHHSLLKAARVSGLGLEGVRALPVNERLELMPEQVEAQLEQDLQQGKRPFMLAATMGTTGAGAFDPLGRLAALAKKWGLWLHADAAYGGALALSPQHQYLLQDLHLADSITFDAHKWMSLPMGTSMYLTRHPRILDASFRTTADYMPKEASQLDITDPFTHSIQWSRRFNGLKVYLALLMLGWEGYREVIEQQIRVGQCLKDELQKSGWLLYNDTPLPIACFGKPHFAQNEGAALALSQQLIQSGQAWISVYRIGGINSLRACITNYATTEAHVRETVALLNSLV
ncbi:pyridoxal phosphate-dependent decarboxylase family protein [Cesiribacter andamanensis]|nr:aminotransferase class V-fold PLP-dependent enzyme [Cesiribacter andamanensis]